jgi:hypothetical protein
MCKLLVFVLVGVVSVVLSAKVDEDKKKTDEQLGLDDSFLPISQVVSPAKVDSGDGFSPELLKRNRRGFRSYFYNYLDEIAMSVCASIPSEGPGLLYAVRRTCGEKSTCKDICTDQKLRHQGPKEVQSLQWACSESLHVYKRQPTLADNYEDYTDSHKLGLAIYRHYSCTIGGCGPNYCCCRAA